jgi:hypothetical protein
MHGLHTKVAANGRLHKELTTTKETAQALESKLRTEIRDLQIALQALESQAGQREDNLRREVAVSYIHYVLYSGQH